ncbi:MAG: major facilitator superfamily 1 [Herbinix sp.]|nr:major facilitator superfamily 1 [Herbinix sp.]
MNIRNSKRSHPQLDIDKLTKPKRIRQMKKKLTTPASIRYFVMICWIAYFSTYLGRLNYAASMNEIVDVGFLTKPIAGMIGTGFFFCYGFGQLISGFLGDRIPSKWMGFAGIFGSAIVNLMMTFANNSNSMLLLWCINGFTQSLTWSPIIKILSDRLSKEQCKKACIFMSTTVAAGTLSAYLMAAAVIGLSNWRNVFLASFVIISLISFVWLIAIGRFERVADEEGFTEEIIESNMGTKTERVKLWKIFLSVGMLPIMFCIILQGILKDGVMTWVPTYISEIFNLGSVTSILATTLLPIVNLGGVYAANYFNTHYFKNEIKTSGVCFMVAALALLLLILFGRYHVLIAVLLLAVTTTGMIGANTMFISLLPLYFTSVGKVSTVTGILNSMAYVGSALSSYGIGVISQIYNWNTTIFIWFFLAIVGSVVCIIVKNTWAHAGKRIRYHNIQ